MEFSQKSIIILHGWQSSKEKWEKVKEKIEKNNIKVLVPDLPGFKEENQISQPWDLNNYLNWLSNFIEKEKKSGNLKDPIFLLGHSFGGRIAIKFSILHPEKIKGLILVSSAGIKPEKSSISNLTPFLKKLYFLPGYIFFRKIFYKFIIKRTDYLNAKGPMKETFKKIVDEDLFPLLPQIKIETLILWGEKDKTTPLSDAYLMKEKIINSKLEILKGLSHVPYSENPEFLAEKILDFVEKK